MRPSSIASLASSVDKDQHDSRGRRSGTGHVVEIKIRLALASWSGPLINLPLHRKANPNRDAKVLSSRWRVVVGLKNKNLADPKKLEGGKERKIVARKATGPPA